ncbi:Retrovirus-related Pol polyprotein from transposon TNT 1-94 [Araneus ventricosus]|uniref:Retrovirus-related Pol polyprotein from transposon TNT 1-94 n=1 Tax=Araneus ventricosus TaxID=182803 RepID=A0A4Y2K6X3_ARAVE|nr:Retrovirus-related Pol polyprotein from transposon TNT 1-94 [Araneus ventricosus]
MLYIVSGYPLLDSVMYTNVDLDLIHKRLCHVNIPIIKDMYKNKSVKGLEKVNIKIGNESCIACNVGKATRTSLKKNYVYKRVTKSVLDKVHMDLRGPAPVNCLGGSKYFLSIIDDFSRKIDVFTLKSKSEVFSIFKEYLSRVQRELGRKLKSVRTDNGMEFCHKDIETFLRDLGIKIERTSFYTPELNGIAERFNRSSMEAVRTMLQDSGLQPRFWAEALHAYVHTKNRCSHKLTEGKTPMEIWSGHKPSIRHCRTFGSLAYVYVPTVNRNKLQPKAKIGILVGYAVNRRGYRVWLPKERKVVESIHVKIDETKNGVKTLFGRVKHYDYAIYQLDQNLNNDSDCRAQDEKSSSPKTPSSLGWNHAQIDVKGSYLYGNLDIPIYMQQPEGFAVKGCEHYVCRLHKTPLGEVDENFYGENASQSNQTETQGTTHAHCMVQSQTVDTDEQDESNEWECPKCTFANHPAIRFCEMCQLPRPQKENPLFLSSTSETCYCHPDKKPEPR